MPARRQPLLVSEDHVAPFSRPSVVPMPESLRRHKPPIRAKGRRSERMRRPDWNRRKPVAGQAKAALSHKTRGLPATRAARYSRPNAEFERRVVPPGHGVAEEGRPRLRI